MESGRFTRFSKNGPFAKPGILRGFPGYRSPVGMRPGPILGDDQERSYNGMRSGFALDSLRVDREFVLQTFREQWEKFSDLFPDLFQNVIERKIFSKHSRTTPIHVSQK